MGKNPAFLFYPGDWIRDPGLNACTLEAQGMWIRMLCFMWQCKPQGYFIINGVSPSDEVASTILGTEVTRFKNCLVQLENFGVFSRNKHGVIYCRRMIKDVKERRDVRARKQRSRLGVSQECHTNVTPMSHRVPVSVPVSVSVSNKKEEDTIAQSKLFAEFWDAYGKKIGRPKCERWYGRNVNTSTHTEIINGISRWRGSGHWDDPQFQPYPYTFLFNRRWEDEPPLKKGSLTEDGRDPVFIEKFLRGEI